MTVAADSARGQGPKKGNGGGGGGGEGTNGGGVIYFRWGLAELYSMNDDGSNLQRLAANGRYVDSGSPSHTLHGGKRWFIKSSLYVAGDWYTALVSEHDDLILLYSHDGDIPVQQAGGLQWTPDDQYISFPGKRQDVDVDSPSFGEYVEFGLYRVKIDYDLQTGEPVGIAAGPEFLFPSPAVYRNAMSTLSPDLYQHSWAVDGVRFAFTNYENDHTLSVGNIEPGLAVDVFALDPETYSWVSAPRWAPGQERIMFHYAASGLKMRVAVIDTTGANLKEIETAKVRSAPYAGHWSPTASHLTYLHRDGSGSDSYLVRATATGGSKTRITGTNFGGGEGPLVLGWRTAK